MLTTSVGHETIYGVQKINPSPAPSILKQKARFRAGILNIRACWEYGAPERHRCGAAMLRSPLDPGAAELRTTNHVIWTAKQRDMLPLPQGKDTGEV